MKMQRFWVGRALLLAVAVLYAGGYVRAQEAKDTLTPVSYTHLVLGMVALTACNNASIEGSWVEPVPGMPGIMTIYKDKQYLCTVFI